MPKRIAAAALLALGACGAPPAEAATVEVVGLPDGSVEMRVDEELVRLAPGASAFRVSPEQVVEVLSGQVWLGLGSVLVKGGPGSSFVLHELQTGTRLVAGKGSLELSLSDGSIVHLSPGEFYEALAAPPSPPGAPVPPPSAGAPPRAPSTPGWDPLNAIGRSLSALAKLQKPELRVVVDLRPFYRLTETYDSNIYLVPPDGPNGERVGGGVVGSWTTRHEAGVRAMVPVTRAHQMEARYTLDYTQYQKQSRANDAVNHQAGLDYTYAGVRDVTGRLSETYVNTQDPAFSELVARERRFQNTVSASVDSRRSRKFAWTVDAQHTIHKYLNPSLGANLNRFETTAGGSAGVLLQPKTRLYVAYHQSLIHYSAGRASNSRSHSAGVGMEGRLTSKLSGRVEVGGQVRKYETAPAGSDKVASLLQAHAQLAFRPAPRDELTLRLSRDLNETVFAANRYSVATSGALSAAHTFRRVTLAANATMEVDRYPEAATRAGLTRARRDDIYSGGVGLDIRLRPWLSLGVGYQRIQRHSTFPGEFNYVDDRTSANLRVAF